MLLRRLEGLELKIRVGMLVGVVMALAGCAVPGMNDLVTSGVSESIQLTGDQKVISSCIVKRFDTEKFSLGELPAQVTRVLASPDGSETELQAGTPQLATVLLWSATIRQTGPGAVTANLVARRDVNPYLSSHYMIDKLRDAVTYCGGLH
jgi:hypothetical protein